MSMFYGPSLSFYLLGKKCKYWHCHGNRGKVTMVAGPIQIHPNEDIKVFNKHQVSDHLYTIFLSMLLGNYQRNEVFRSVWRCINCESQEEIPSIQTICGSFHPIQCAPSKRAVQEFRKRNLYEYYIWNMKDWYVRCIINIVCISKSNIQI